MSKKENSIVDNFKFFNLNDIYSKNFLDSKITNNNSQKRGLSFGQKAADSLALWAGSWTFILLFFLVLIAWMFVNSYFLINSGTDPFDPYPFILLNLVLSCLAAIQAPIILMSQNRAAERDRLRAEYDYAVNRKAEREIRNLQMKLEEISKKIK